MRAFNDFDEELQRLKTQGRFRHLEIRRNDGIHLITEDQGRLCNFGTNDYLGFASKNCQPNRQGAGASALVCGWSHLHQGLVKELARLESKESVCLFPSGYAASSGTVSTLPGAGDVIFSDELNHASLIDGCRLSKAKCFIYPHRNITQLRDLLSEHRKDYDNAWIVTDSVFSMDGHLAPLEELCSLRDEFDTALIIDEAHATGVLGEKGAGLAEWLNVKERVDVVIGTLSKAVGSHGGFVASNETVVNYLINRCRPLIYSTALPQSSVVAATESVRIIQENSTERKHVTTLAQMFREELGIQLSSKEMMVPIIPVIIGEDEDAVSLASHLLELGFYVPAIRPPTVPKGLARLRISLSALHTREMVTSLVKHLKPLIRELTATKT